VNAKSENGSIDYGADELSAVAEMFGAPGFPGVDAALSAGSSEEVRDAALASARRSLLARGVLTIDEEGLLQITPPHSVLFRVALAPGAVVDAEHRRSDAIETRSYYLLPVAAVEHAVAIGNVHRLERFEPDELLSRVRDFVGLAERPSGEADEIELPVAVLNRALADGDDAQLPAEAAALGEAIGNLVSTSYVRCLHREGKALVGGELRWIDTGGSGLWLIEPSADDPERVKVRRTSAHELLDELLSYLPGGERQPAAT
jgi:hypothetical protein